MTDGQKKPDVVPEAETPDGGDPAPGAQEAGPAAQADERELDDPVVSLDTFVQDTILTFSRSMVDFEKRWRRQHVKHPQRFAIQLKRSEWSELYHRFMKG
jgi:hypothetical protein